MRELDFVDVDAELAVVAVVAVSALPVKFPVILPLNPFSNLTIPVALSIITGRKLFQDHRQPYPFGYRGGARKYSYR